MGQQHEGPFKVWVFDPFKAGRLMREDENDELYAADVKAAATEAYSYVCSTECVATFQDMNHSPESGKVVESLAVEGDLPEGVTCCGECGSPFPGIPREE